MHHKHDYKTDDQDTLDTHIKIDSFLESLKTCIVFKKREYLK